MKKLRGFAAMDRERVRELAARGGSSVPSEKRAFSQSQALAQSAGRKGGRASTGNFKHDPKRAKAIGARGGRPAKGGDAPAQVSRG